MPTITNFVRGPRLIPVVTALIAVGVILTLLLIPDPEQAWRSAIRLTARSSVVLFLLAFGAGAAAMLWPGKFTRWMRGNRRYLGLSFAASHTIHAFTFLSLAGQSPLLADQVLPRGMVVLGGIGYFFIYALAATSSNKAQAILGMRWWSRLHVVGTHWLWLQFFISFIKHASDHPEDWVGVVLVVAVMTLRIVARQKVVPCAQTVASV
jgi:methionine sulfoxide reductase heme-binding subunit